MTAGARAAAVLTAAASFACGAGSAAAATPAPRPSEHRAPQTQHGPQRVNVEQLEPKSLFPKVPLHVEFTVETNRLGQVTRVRSVKPSKNRSIDAITYGNALQAFIRTPDGRAIPGTYRLTYDYDPKTTRFHRDVALVHAGGVNPNAQGAALQMMQIVRNQNRKNAHAQPTPNPAPSVKIGRMPDLPQVMKSPPPHGH